MNGEKPSDEEELSRLAAALGYDPEREPPPSRVAALRGAAEELRRGRRAEGSSLSRRRRSGGGTPTRLPRRRDLLIGGMAASVGAAAGVGGRELLSGDPPVAPPTEVIAFVGAPSGVQSDARLINHTWGTELLLDVSGLPDGDTYRIEYVSPSGEITGAGSFLSVSATVMKCRFNAAPLRAGVAAISVVGPQGEEVMRADLA